MSKNAHIRLNLKGSFMVPALIVKKQSCTRVKKHDRVAT